MTERVAAAALAVAIVLGSVPLGVAAQGGPSPLLLNQQTTRVAEVTVDGTTYAVYRYDNLVSSASGIEIGTGGDTVNSKSVARAVLTELATRQAVASLGTAETRELRRIRRKLDDLEARFESTLSETNAMIERLEGLRTNETAWDAAVSVAPDVRNVSTKIRSFRSDLRRYQDRLASVSGQLSNVTGLIERYGSGEDVSAKRVYRRYVAAREAVVELGELIGIDDFDFIDTTAEELKRMAETVAGQVEGSAEVPRSFAEALRSFAGEAGSFGRHVHQAKIETEDLARLESTRNDRRAELMEDWRKRRHASTDVYGSIGIVAVGLIAVAGVAKYRFL